MKAISKDIHKYNTVSLQNIPALQKNFYIQKGKGFKLRFLIKLKF